MQSSLQRRGVAATHGKASLQGFDRPRPCRRFVSSLATPQQAELVARPRPTHISKPPCTRTYAAAAGYGAADDGLPSPVQSLLTSKYDREIWSLALPALMSMLLDPLMMMMGSAIVGHLGTQQLAAVSMASLAVAFSSFMFSFLVFLTTPKVAAAAQQKNDALVSRIASNGIWLAAGIGLVSCFGLFFFAKDIVGREYLSLFHTLNCFPSLITTSAAAPATPSCCPANLPEPSAQQPPIICTPSHSTSSSRNAALHPQSSSPQSQRWRSTQSSSSRRAPLAR